jgi:type II secretory pathway predicted ATPase ExeA/tRNA A-37 threonylcarbamoyl transferase component Bud32
VEAAPAAVSFKAPALPQIEPLALLGAGGFGTVFAGRDRQGREVAVKLAHRPGDQRFEREAEALRSIGPPAAPALYDGDVTLDGRSYLIEERLFGQTLADSLAVLPGEGAMRPAEVEALCRSLCRAVAAVHQAGYVHRDLKPENVFLRSWGGDDRVVTLLDFGLARPLAPSPEDPGAFLTLTRTGQQLGSTHYMAPEQLADPRRADERADLYALGAILYECLTGRPPFVGEEAAVRHAHAARRAAPPSCWVASAAWLDPIVLRCLAKDPAQRFASAPELAAAVSAALMAPPEPPSPSSEPRAVASMRTVGLLGVRSSLPVTEIAATAEREGGHLARAREDGYLLLFPQMSARTAVRAGLTAGRALLPHLGPSDRLVLHAASLRVRESARATQAVGADLDTPAGWWPGALDDRRASISPAGAALLDGATFDDAPADAGSAPVDAELPPPAAVPVVGRDQLLGAMHAQAERALDESLPLLTTLVGEVGSGKTRFLEAMDARLAGRARVIRVQFRSPEAAGLETATALLCRAAFAPDARSDLGWAAGASREALAQAIAQRLRPTQPTALLIDDAQWADPCALDALELAAMRAGAPLWVLVATSPELFDRRPLWAARAARHATHHLGPLGAEAERSLLRHLLAPAELIPTDLLAALGEMVRGIPLFAVEIAGALRAAGAIRRAGTGGWYLAGDEILAVSSTPLAARLADRLLGPAPPALRAFAELCAVLGDELTRGEVIAVERCVSAADRASEPLDPQVALERLTRLGVLRAEPGGRWQFRHPLLRAAIEELAPAARRRQLHRLVLTALSARGGAAPAVIARHAALCGAHEEAFTNHFHLAEQARTGHHYQEADEHYTAALAHLDDGDARRARVLAGRAKVRYPVQRFADAMADLAASRRHAEAAGDAAALAELLLEEATIHDWSEGWVESAERVARAAPLVERAGDPGLRARWLMALGRTRYREEKMEEAAQHLAAGQAGARAVDDHETWAIATMLLGTALISVGRLDEAEAQLAEVIASCQRAGDTLHLCSAYNNRIILWIKRESLERAIADQRRATALSREIAHVQLERMSTVNLSELLYWRGDLTYALALALRARELQTRFLDEVSLDALLVARICCGLALLGSDAEVSAPTPGGLPAANSAVRGADLASPAARNPARRAHLQIATGELRWVQAHCPPERRSPLVQMQVRLLEQLVAPAGEDHPAIWRTLVEEARRTAVTYELQETVHFAAAAALWEGRLEEARVYLDEGAALAGASQLWSDRFAALPAAVSGITSATSPTPAPAPASAAHPPPGQSAIHFQQGDIDDPPSIDSADRPPRDRDLV